MRHLTLHLTKVMITLSFILAFSLTTHNTAYSTETKGTLTDALNSQLETMTQNYETIIEKNIYALEERFNLGYLYGQQEQYNKMNTQFDFIDKMPAAIKWKEKAKKARHEFWLKHYDMAVKALNAGNSSIALDHFKTAIKIDPTKVESHEGLAINYLNQGRLVEGIKAYKIVVAMDKQNVKAFHNIGVALLQANKKTEALSYLKQGLQLEPNNAKILEQIVAIEGE